MAQARQTTKNNNPLASHIIRGLKEGALFIFGFTALYFFLSLVSYDAADPSWTQSGLSGQKDINNLGGPTGALISDVFFFLFGYLAYLFPVMVAFTGLLIYRDRQKEHVFDKRGFAIRTLGFVLTILAGCALASMHDLNLASPLPVNA
ncbi:MAG: DNA translocase FtsK 4TM domain-containing protein, partial [Gammaproteobacteria bacterium]|nr:DNA translocase FtsK 4TM domain-containing protein [Gammaproteobacteria bacterium]